MSRLDTMTPRELLMVLTSMGVQVTSANAVVPGRKAHGARAVRRRARRVRAMRLERRQQHNSWRAYGEEEKRRAEATA